MEQPQRQGGGSVGLALQQHLDLGGQALVSLLSGGHSDTVALRQGDVSLVTLADDEDVLKTSGECVSCGILNVNDVE